MNLVSKRDIQNLIATRPRLSDQRNRASRSSHDSYHPLEHWSRPDGRDQNNTIALTQKSVEKYDPPQETLEEIEKVRIALEKLDPDSPRGNGKDPGKGIWLIATWAVASLGWASTKKILREWSKRSSKYDPEEFEKTYDSYDPAHSKPIRIGTLYKLAEVGSDGHSSSQKLFTHERSDSINLSDVANGQHMAAMFRGTLMSIRDTPNWIRWHENVGWERAETEFPMQAAKVVLEKMRKNAAQAMMEGRDTSKLVREITRTSKHPSMKAMVKQSESEPGMTVGLSELDKDPFLLGVKNGVVDLKTGKLIAPNPSVLVVKRANVNFDPNAAAPRFRKFLEEIVPNAELRAFLVRLLAYLTTGSIKEHYWFFFVGGGRNGKSILMRVIEKLLGEYSKKISVEMLMKTGPKQQGSPSPEILQLQGRRFVYANETTEGQRLDDARIKDLTGGDTLSGRALYSDFASFDPTHKLLITGNNYPIVHDDSHGFWARVVVFPFDVTFTEDQIDRNLEGKLLRELPGILNVVLEGMKDYLANGLQVPDRLTQATQAYRSDQDTIQQFINEECEICIGFTILKKDCYAAYQQWARENGMLPMSSRRFSIRLKKHGISTMRDQRTLTGLKFRPPNEEGPADSQTKCPF